MHIGSADDVHHDERLPQRWKEGIRSPHGARCLFVFNQESIITFTAQMLSDAMHNPNVSRKSPYPKSHRLILKW